MQFILSEKAELCGLRTHRVGFGCIALTFSTFTVEVDNEKPHVHAGHGSATRLYFYLPRISVLKGFSSPKDLNYSEMGRGREFSPCSVEAASHLTKYLPAIH